MKEQEIVRHLAPKERPSPPPELVARIKEEIPADLAVSGPTARDTSLRWRRHRWLLAASLVTVVTGAVLTYRVYEEMPVSSLAPSGDAHPDSVGSNEVSLRDTPSPASPGSVGETRERAGESRSQGPSGPAPEPLARGRRGGEIQSQPKARREPVEAEALELRDRRPGLDQGVLAGGEAERLRRGLAESRQDEARKSVPRGDARAGIESDDAAASGLADVAPPSPSGTPPEAMWMAEEATASRKRRILAPAPQPAPVPEPAPSRPAPIPDPAPALVAADEVSRFPMPRRLAVPNDQAFDAMFFDAPGVNPFLDTEDDPLSTFGLDVDTGSYTLARGYLNRGHLPPPAGVRVEEFLNFFDYGDEPPRGGDFALTAEGAPSPFGEGPRYRLLRVGLRARDLDPAERRPALLTFLVDVSGSMARGNRLGLVQDALSLLVERLGPEDRLALVVYNEQGRVVLEPTRDRDAVMAALRGLRPGGSTNLEEGFVLAYDLAARYDRRGITNRVILCSDGVANVGQTGASNLLERIARQAAQGIELTTVGVGLGNYNDRLMEALADRGNGRYTYVDTLEEARRVFVEDLTGTLETVAADAKIQVEFNPSVVSRYRLLGYENRHLPDQAFRDDDADGGEIGVGHRVSALYELKLQPRPPRRAVVATVRLRYGSVASGEVEETSRVVHASDFAASWEEAPVSLRLASLVAEFAEILRGSYWAREGDLDDVFRRSQALLPEFPGESSVAELVSLMGRARDLRSSR